MHLSKQTGKALSLIFIMCLLAMGLVGVKVFVDKEIKQTISVK